MHMISNDIPKVDAHHAAAAEVRRLEALPEGERDEASYETALQRAKDAYFAVLPTLKPIRFKARE
jgi:hypothetical protein